MRKWRWAALLTAGAVLFGVASVAGVAGHRAVAAGQNGLRVFLRTGAVRPAAATENQNPAERGLWVLQFRGPVQEEWKAAVGARGAELGDYLPDYAFVARMDGATAGEVGKLPYVAGVARLTADQKLDPALQGVSGSVAVRALAFRGEAGGIVGIARSLGARAPGGGEPRVVAGGVVLQLSAERLRELAALPDVLYLEPVRQNQLFNDQAAAIIQAPGAGWQSGLDGSGQIVAVADTGLDTGDAKSMHPDFQGRIEALFALGRRGNASDTHGHGTHVAGSVLGSGEASGGKVKGMAPKARLVFQSVADAQGGLGGIPEDLGQLFRQAYEAGARIHSDSWGVPATRGGATYDAQSQALDRFIWENPEMAILFAAGNDGDHDQDGRPNYGTVSTPGTAKNAITVDATENRRPDQGKHGDNPDEVAIFSSRGLTGDGRVKPDIVAPGTWILSTKSSRAPDSNFWKGYDSRYAYMGGTSMATPITAGATALVRQFFMEKLQVTPRASLLKAALINGGLLVAGDRKDHGWGRVDLKETLDPGMKFENEAVALATGEQKKYRYQVAGGQPLRVTLVWTDYPASPSAAKTLVNDLDLEVITPDGQVLQGNRDLLGLQGPDRTNNVENVRLAAPRAGSYTVRVKAHNVPQGPQRYALVVTGDLNGDAPPQDPPKDPPQDPGQDREPPAVKLEAPAAGTVLRGTVTLAAQATDNGSGVERVEFYLDGTRVGTTTAAPYRIQWQSRQQPDGVYNLWVRAYDKAGNKADAGPHRVEIRNAAAAPEVVTEAFTGSARRWGTVERLYFESGAGTGKLQFAAYGWMAAAIQVYGPDGRRVLAVDNNTAARGVAMNLAKEGLYMVLISHYGGSGDYKLLVTHPSSPGVAREQFRGTVTAGGNAARAEEALVVSRAGFLNLGLEWQGKADLDLYLLDAAGRVVARADSPNRNPETLSLQVAAGTYKVRVVADWGQGRYTLTAMVPR